MSGHCIVSGAAAQALRLALGNDGVPFSATVAGNLSRSYQNLTQVEQEFGDARVWAGIHTRSADEHGGVVGHKIAELVVQWTMKPQAQGIGRGHAARIETEAHVPAQTVRLVWRGCFKPVAPRQTKTGKAQLPMPWIV